MNQRTAVDVEYGGRHPEGWMGRMLVLICLAWSLFQLWIASPFPFSLGIGVFNDTQARAIHLAFALFLAYTAYPALKRSATRRIPWSDLLIALAAAASAAYLVVFYQALAERAGAPTQIDILVAVVGLVLLLEATRRALGPPLMVVAGIFLVYTFAGPYMPEVIAHKGASLSKVTAHQWLTTEGVFGVALGISTSFVFLFVLFGSLLDRAGAGRFFIELAFSMLGHMRGGPAKAAVVASGLSGIISGSSIANVVTTGTFTIPLMKRVGFPASKAGAIEVAASTNGQLTPPIMGAAAFLMVEYVGISYLEVIKHALLPALVSYVALIYIVHLEALKAGMKGLEPNRSLRLLARLVIALSTILVLILLSLFVYFGIGWIKLLLGAHAVWVLSIILLVVYVSLVAWAASVPSPKEVLVSELQQIPDLKTTLRSGLYYLLPVCVLVWCLAVERLSPGLSAFWATLFLVFIVLTQQPLRAFFNQENLISASRQGVVDLLAGLVQGARNMIGIGVATAAAGIIVGTVTLTGVGLVMTEFVEFISGGNLVLILLFTAIISLLLGMGLPTTANYIVVSTLMAPVIVALGAQHGLVVPLIAVHLFVFYFGILADDTPPVGLAAFAASAIARSDPIRTGLQGFTYDIRTAVLPFMFIFNTELLLIGITSGLQLILVVGSAVVAMMCFAAATQRYWFRKNRWWESLVLVVLAFSLFRPGFWWDQLYPPRQEVRVETVAQIKTDLEEDGKLMLMAEGQTLSGEQARRKVVLELGEKGQQQASLSDLGLELRQADGAVMVESVGFGSAAQEAGLDLDWRIDSMIVALDRPSKYWMILPVLLLLFLLAWNQLRTPVQTESNARQPGD